MTKQQIALAIAALLAIASTTHAQTVPYQAPQRSEVGGGVGQQALPRGSVFSPRIEAAVQYASNITLAEDGQPQVDTAGIELAPGFYAAHSSGSLVGAVDYALVGRIWEDDDFNDVSQRLSANGEWLAVPEWVALRADATYNDAVIDPRAGLNYGGLGIFGSGNLQEMATASLNPVLQHRFKGLDFAADYRYGRVWFFDEGKGQEVTTAIRDRDSTDQSANVTLGSSRDGARLYGTAFYTWQKSEYEQTVLPYEFEKAGLDAGLRLTRTLYLVGDGGVETDLSQRAAQGGLDATFWGAGLRWVPNELTYAEARYRDQSYGASYSFNARHRARLLEFRASYSELPTVETRELSLSDIIPGELPPGIPDFGLGIFNSLPYILRNATVGVTAAGSRTTLGVSAFWYERDYLANSTNGSDENGVGGSVLATRQLASNLSADCNVSYREYERTPDVDLVSPVTDRDTQVLLRLNRTSGNKLTLSAETGYLQRTGDVDYDGWWVAMRARWTP